MIDKESVRSFWNQQSCGEALYLQGADLDAYHEQARHRFELEPYIEDFAGFRHSGGLRVLEIGTGLGADHQKFAEAGAKLYGIDLTERAIQHTGRRLALMGLSSELQVGDAENLPFPDGYFDVVYSWGVLHHSPDTRRAVSEVYRVLRPGGQARVMIYNYYSLIGFMLWFRYALLRFRPRRSLKDIYSKYLESPGTKAYTSAQARELFREFASVHTRIELTHGDLLESAAGQRHQGPLLWAARKLWPRVLLRRFAKRFGLFLLISGVK